jgi:hypothetical protein
VQLRDLIVYLREYPSVHTLLFTGGNSKNGPEYFFRKILREYGIPLKPIQREIPRIHEVILPGPSKMQRLIRTVSLIAPSGAANRAVGSLVAYKAMKRRNPGLTTLDFRIAQYRQHFLGSSRLN